MRIRAGHVTAWALAAVIATRAPAALAGGVSLYWNECGLGASAATNQTFACDTNEGQHVLVASFDPGSDLPNLNGMAAILELVSESCPLADWWQVRNPGSCRPTGLSVTSDVLADQGACADPLQGQATSVIAAFTPGVGGDLRRAHIELGAAAPVGLAVPISGGTEYYGFNLLIRNVNTVGAGACAGCADKAYLTLQRIELYTDEGGFQWITNPLGGNYVLWQGGGPGCFEPACMPSPCTTPTLNRTWGRIKAIYH